MVRKGFLNSKSVAFTSIISALGAVLSLSVFALPLGPGVALDLSHIGTYIVAIGGGPILGAIAGALVGIIPAFRFANIGLVIGKSLTGLSVGAIYFALRRIKIFKKKKLLTFIPMIIAGIVGYLPEYVFTIWDLNYIVHLPLEIIFLILAKVWIEIPVISGLTVGLYSIPTIRNEVNQLVGENAKLGVIEYSASGIVIILTMLFIFAINYGGLTDPNAQFFFNILVVVLLIVLGILVAFVIVRVRQRAESTIDMLRKMLSVSKRIELDMMRQALGLDANTFNTKIFEWASEFKFKIDGNYVVMEDSDVKGFISKLDAEFKIWDKKKEDKA